MRRGQFFAELTDGAFDPTVWPIWQLHADHFASDNPNPVGPSGAILADTLARVGHRGLLVGRDRIAPAKRGAAITLNGIAQGYVTDRVVETLREAGLSTTLVNMGDIRSVGARPDGAPWRVGLADPGRPKKLSNTIDLMDRAVATTAGAVFRFDTSDQFTHVFDPVTGRSPALYRTVSVIAPTGRKPMHCRRRSA